MAKADKRSIVKRQFLNVLHHNKAVYDRDWFGKGQAVLVVERVWFDDGGSEKRLQVMKDPTVRYYVTEGDRSQDRPQLYVDKAICAEYESKVDILDKHVAELTDQMAYYRETNGPGARRKRRKLHDHRDVHGSDVNLTDHYIDRYFEATAAILDNNPPLQMAFSDIEVDIIEHNGFPEEREAPCPVSLISYFHKPSKTLYQFHNRQSVRENPLRDAFEEQHEAMAHWILAEVNRSPLSKTVERVVKGSKVKEPALIGPDATPEDIHAVLATEAGRERQRCDRVELVFCDGEIDLFSDYFHQVNEVDKPDINAFWNMRFDALTLINRMKRLERDPEEFFCPRDFDPYTIADYQEDDFNTTETDRGDTFTVTGWTQYVDQMLLYASLRKQAGKKESYSLDFTLEAEIKENKHKYEGNIRDFMYRDYGQFSLYGAIDVVPMATLEEKTDDIALNYQLSCLTRTRFSKTMKKTICLRNFASIFYRERGLVLSNNHNRNKERTGSEKFKGAFVSDPNLMDWVGADIGGTRSNRVFEDTVDFDAASLYPSIIRAFLVDAMAQYGRIVLIGENGDVEDSSLFVEAMKSGDAVEVGREWFGMPGLSGLLEQVVLEQAA